MQIAGFVPNSFIDYPSKIAALVFAPGCNMNCTYCHNFHLLGRDASKVLYNPRSILSDLERKRGFIDGIVLTGGEPTLQNGLVDFARKLKDMDFLVKLDTNGTNPDVISDMLDKALIDYIAMDIKAPFERYDEVCGRKIDIDKIKKSIDIIMKSNIKYEFRTTFWPKLLKEDIEKIASHIKGAQCYTLQQYRPTERTSMVEAHSPSYVCECGEQVEHYFEKFRILGL